MASTATAPASGTGAVVFNQSGTYVVVPELPSVEEPNGYVYVTILAVDQDSVRVSFTVGVRKDGTVSLKVYSLSGQTLFSHASEARAGSVLTVNATLPSGHDAFVYSCSIAGSQLPLASFRVPREVPLPPDSPDVLRFLLALVAVAVPLGFALTGDLRRASLSLFASLPFIYVLLSNLMPPGSAPYITGAVALTFIIALLYFVVGRG